MFAAWRRDEHENHDDDDDHHHDEDDDDRRHLFGTIVLYEKFGVLKRQFFHRLFLPLRLNKGAGRQADED